MTALDNAEASVSLFQDSRAGGGRNISRSQSEHKQQNPQRGQQDPSTRYKSGDLEEPCSKRRRISVHPGILRDQPAAHCHLFHCLGQLPQSQAQLRCSSTMTTARAQSMPIIHLTPLEETLKSLLLDVASYISTTGSNYSNQPHGTPEGLVLRFTGGWVRDKLLGVQSKDIDVGISSMTGYQFGLALKEYLDNPANLEKYKNQTGVEEDQIISLHKISANPEKSKHLETVTTKIFGLEVDLVNLRKETYTEDSRNPQMEFGTPYEDAMRRDATVNALFYNLNTSSIEDFTGTGLQDMQNKLIRTPLEPFQTFKDDPLRVLRLIRFSSRLRYEIDPETALAMGLKDIKKALKVKISPERVGIEVSKTLRGPDPFGALRFIDQNNLFNVIFINHSDTMEAATKTSSFSWSSVYESLRELLDQEPSAANLDIRQNVRNTLIRDDTHLYQAWLLAALSPWSVIPLTDAKGNAIPPNAKMPPRARSVARDGMRLDNKTLSVVGDAATTWQGIQQLVAKVVSGEMEKSTSPEDFRENIGLFMRDLGADWRMSVLLAMLLECTTKDKVEVFKSYNIFLQTLSRLSLVDVHTMKPIVNGHELATALGVPSGAWMFKALTAIIHWQLRNPNVTGTDADKQKAIEEVRSRREEIGWDAPSEKKGSKGKDYQDQIGVTLRSAPVNAVMERIKATAAEYARHVQEDSAFDLRISTVPPDVGLTALWQYLSHDGAVAQTDSTILEKLIALNIYLNSQLSLKLDGDSEIQVWTAICQWTSDQVVPDEAFAKTWAEIKLEEDACQQRELLFEHRLSRLKYSAGVHALKGLNSRYGILNIAERIQIIATLAAYISSRAGLASLGFVENPWALPSSAKCAEETLNDIEQASQVAHLDFGQTVILEVAKKVIKPTFARSRSDAITSEGRKARFPIQRQHFDSSLFSHDTKPWKKEAIWVVSVLGWVARWYEGQPLNILEGDLPLLIPAVLSLLDDSTLAFKAKGCELLSLLLEHMKRTESEFLRQTNLDDVFADALRPCLTYLPTLNEEKESVYLLSRAYPALFKLIEVRYHQIPRTKPDEVRRSALLGRILHSDIIRSYHHTSVVHPTEGTTLTSFPYITLSVLLLDQLKTAVQMLQLEAIPYLRDLIATIVPTLSNAFIMADPRLARSAIEALRIVILNAWPRIYHWRGDVCAGLTDAWIRLYEEYLEPGSRRSAEELERIDDIRMNLRETLAITRIAAQECIDVAGHPDESQSEFNRDDKEADYEEADKKAEGERQAFDRVLRDMMAVDDRLDGLIGWVLKEGNGGG
ncbi:CCA tRNA nucleotidyltransferase, mitochondrial [Ascosphaera aggregata]|nr:CCA tRNA nucleotidyltransferase, mitochondrial [Ascosphaera aggregata]